MNTGGLLLIPSNKNGNAIRNILSIVFNKYSIKHNALPYVDKITFLENDDLENIQLDGTLYSASVFYEKIINDLNLHKIEFRRKKILNYSIDIPNVIVSAICEVGKNNIVLDLTNGKRDITGSLYTAASICEIENMIYIEVHRQTDCADFYELSPTDANINDKYHLIKFKPLDEMENLASLNFMDFIAYKKIINDIKCDGNCQTLELYCDQLDNAIESYFQSKNDSVNQCIRSIGIVNEKLIGLLNQDLKKRYESFNNTIKKPGNPNMDKNNAFYYINLYNDAYIQLCRKQKQLLNEEEKNAFSKLSALFSYVPTLSHLLSSIKIYRNQVSHGLNDCLNKEDAKIVIDCILKILNGLKRSGLLGEILSNE